MLSIDLGSFNKGDKVLLRFENTLDIGVAIVTEVNLSKPRLLLRRILVEDLGSNFKDLRTTVPQPLAEWKTFELFSQTYGTE
jgi:hypothetical protein